MPQHPDDFHHEDPGRHDEEGLEELGTPVYQGSGLSVRALTAYRQRRATELVGWTHSLAWRAPLVAAAGLTVQVLATRTDLPWAGWLA
jgi:hypothetical protein